MNAKNLFLVLTLLAAVAVTLVSCGRNASENAPAPETAPAKPAPANPPPAAGPATTATNAAGATKAP